MNYSIFIENIVISNLQLFTQIHKIKIYNQINIFVVVSISIILFGDPSWWSNGCRKEKKDWIVGWCGGCGPHLWSKLLGYCHQHPRAFMACMWMLAIGWGPWPSCRWSKYMCSYYAFTKSHWRWGSFGQRWCKVEIYKDALPVSYTHLTLPTKRIV